MTTLLLLQASADKGSEAQLYIIIGLVITTIVGPIVVKLLNRKKGDSDVHKSIAEANKTDAEAQSILDANRLKLLTSLYEAAEKFKIAQDNYFAMKESNAELREQMADYEQKMLEVADLVELDKTIPIAIKLKMAAIKKIILERED